ncbi:MAG TPA: response regulator [Caulobacterales bacterium]|nr:response regulator [Caulobacterales bacterium]
MICDIGVDFFTLLKLAMTKPNAPTFLICDENQHARRLIVDVLASANFDRVQQARTGSELLKKTVEYQPRVVITSSRIPDLSGLEYTRKIRAGYESVSRSQSIIVMTNTPTEAFLFAARESGVDEMLVRPFTGAALLARVEAVLLRPRRLIESLNYVGPCRRRRMLDDYAGVMRRFTDPLECMDKAPWEAEANRELVRCCVTKISDLAAGLSPSDRRRLREIFAAVQDTEQLADDVRDQALGDASRSLGRYIGAMGATGLLDLEVVTTHIEAMQKLAYLGSEHGAERARLVEGLVAVVDKRLGRKPAVDADSFGALPPSLRLVSGG